MSGLNQPALVIGASPVVGGTSGQFLSVGVNGELEQSPSSAIFGIGDPVSGGTSGSVLFVDASGNLGQANTVFNWDPTNQKLGIGQINNASDHPKLLVGNGAQQIHFHADASIGTFSEFWKDGTPTYAGAFGMQVPGNPPGNNPTLSYYNGTWNAGLTIDGTTGAVTVPNAATIQGAFTANPVNANISLAPSGTGTVTINPATAGSIDNMLIGGTTPAAVTGTRFIPTGSTVPANGMYLVSTNALGFSTNSTLRATLDANGNLGLGVTPSAWLSSQVVLEMPGIAVASETATAGDISQNTYRNASGQYIYKTTNPASLLQLNSSSYIFYQASSGTAGSVISWTPAMTLNANGRLLLGTATDDGANIAQFNGTLSVHGTPSGIASKLSIGDATQTTVGANGAASALTANPLGYLIAYLGTTKIAIPYYNG